jgi:hypothetical protein
VQSETSVRGGPLHELLALVIRQAEQVRFGHRSPTVWRFFDAIEHGVICGGGHVIQSDAPLHELSERVGGVRLEHSAHQLREFGRTWLVALAHVLSIPCAPNVRIFPHNGTLGEHEPCGLRPDLDIDADCVMVWRNAGPVGAPGMPERGRLPIPAKLLKRGVSDPLRISHARMSGPSYGAVVLHVAPESAGGGPLARVRTGDRIRLDLRERRLDVVLDDAELAQRREAWTPPPPQGRARLPTPLGA